MYSAGRARFHSRFAHSHAASASCSRNAKAPILNICHNCYISRVPIQYNICALFAVPNSNNHLTKILQSKRVAAISLNHLCVLPLNTRSQAGWWKIKFHAAAHARLSRVIKYISATTHSTHCADDITEQTPHTHFLGCADVANARIYWYT